MKKILVFGIFVLSLVVTGFTFYYALQVSNNKDKLQSKDQGFKRPIMRVALVADSHNENDLLGKALRQAQGKGINFVIGLGDYTNLGTVGELNNAKREFEKSGLEYYVTAGDRDGWDSRDKANVALQSSSSQDSTAGLKGTNNFIEVFSKSSQIIDRENVLFVLLDNSDIYTGISREDWEMLEKGITGNKGTTSTTGTTGSNSSRDTRGTLDSRGTLTFVFAHKTPFHPQSSHIMGEDSEQVAEQAKQLIKLIEEKNAGGLFSGDLHFFAKFNSPNGSVKISTIGAIASERNFQGPRFAVLTVWEDYTWEVEDIEIR